MTNLVKSTSDMLEKSKRQIAMALPKSGRINVDSLVRVARSELMNNPSLAECTPQSFCGAIIQAAQLGLTPGSAHGECYLVPYNNRKTGRKEAQFQVSYRGMMTLVRRGGDIKSLIARAVYEGDEFEYQYGLEDKLSHVEHHDTDNLTHVYAKVEFLNGGKEFVVMTKKQVEKIRQASPGKNGNFWSNHYEEMAKKTVMRRLCKYLPISTEYAVLMSKNDESEFGESQENEHSQNLEGVFEANYSKNEVDDINKQIAAQGAKQ